MASTTRKLPKRWSEAEDAILHREVMKHSSLGDIKEWSCIADHLPGRNNKDCRKRWVNNVCGGLNKGPWKSDEDQRLRVAVGAHGQKWPRVAAEVASRSPDQCAKRWQHSLDPNIKLGGWTAEEDGCLLESVQTYGRQWKKIQKKYYPLRSRNDVKNRYTILTRKANKAETACPLGGLSVDDSYRSEAPSPLISAASDLDLQDSYDDDGDPSNAQLDLDFMIDTTLLEGDLEYPVANHTSSMFSHQNQGYPEAGDGAMSWFPTPSSYQESLDLHQHGGPSSLEYTDDCLLEGGTAGSATGNTRFLEGQLGLSAYDEIFMDGSSRDPPGEHDNTAARVDPGLSAEKEESSTANITLMIRDCDRETLNYLIDVTQPIKGKVRMEIDM